MPSFHHSSCLLIHRPAWVCCCEQEPRGPPSGGVPRLGSLRREFSKSLTLDERDSSVVRVVGPCLPEPIDSLMLVEDGAGLGCRVMPLRDPSLLPLLIHCFVGLLLLLARSDAPVS